jgi:excisionase family DNA binding protein
VAGVPYGQGNRMLMISELCAWLNITERHARKLVERDAIPYRKIGHLLRFPEAEIEEWSHPKTRRATAAPTVRERSNFPASSRSAGCKKLPKSLLD